METRENKLMAFLMKNLKKKLNNLKNYMKMANNKRMVNRLLQIFKPFKKGSQSNRAPPISPSPTRMVISPTKWNNKNLKNMKYAKMCYWSLGRLTRQPMRNNWPDFIRVL